MIFKHIVLLSLLSVLALVLLNEHFHFNDILAEKLPFSRVGIRDLYGDWLSLSPKGNNTTLTTSSGHILYLSEPISRTDCKIEGPTSNISYAGFPSPDLSSVTYFSDGTTLNPTLWLTEKYSNTSIIPFLNDSTGHQALYHIAVLDSQKMPLDKFVNREKESLNQTLENFKLNSTRPTNETWYEMVFTFNGSKTHPCIECKARQVFTIKNDKLFILSYVADVNKYSKFLKSVQTLINATNIYNSISTISQKKDKNQTYENDDHRINITYPDRWVPIENERPPDENGIDDIVEFESPSDNATLKIQVDHLPGEDITLKKYYENINDNYRSDPTLKINKTVSGINMILNRNEAYNILFEHKDTRSKKDMITREIGTLIGDDKIYRIQFITPSEKYDELWTNEVQNMTDSFNAYVSTLTYDNSSLGLKVEYPYNWTKREKVEPLFGDHNGTHISDVSFYSPISGKHSISKGYRLNIDWISAYGEQHAPYSIAIYSDWKNNKTWTKVVDELSLDGKQERELDSEPNYKELELFGKENINVLFKNIDLGSLNLPDEFSVNFVSHDIFLNEGQYCDLKDQTEFVSIPPPEFSVSTDPATLKGIRPGEKETIQIKITSAANLPYQIWFPPIEKQNLDFVFKPSLTSGIPNSSTTTDLHVDVSADAEPKSYTFPIVAKFILGSTENANNTGVANIYEPVDFTVTVSPPITFQEIMSRGLIDWFNPISGAVAAVVAIVTGIIGWGLHKSKKSKGNAKKSKGNTLKDKVNSSK